jgi:heme/copper-type cytochrome/quinol oxidase subunit 2
VAPRNIEPSSEAGVALGSAAGPVGMLADMTIGTSILLIAVGAILKYAVTAHVSGIDLQTVGVILMLVGILGLILSLLYTFVWSDRARARTADPYDERTRNLPPR